MTKYLIVGGLVLLVVGVIAFILKRNRGEEASTAAPAPPPSMPPASTPRAQAPGQAQPAANAAALRPAPPAQGGGRVNWLVGRRGAVAGKTFHVGERRATIGRGVSNFIQVLDDQVSRVHCQLLATAAGLQVKDLNSRTGTLINGEKVEEANLKNGDQIRIGDSVLEFWRHGTFSSNAALEAKESGEEAKMATKAVDLAGDMKEVARKAVAKHNGDVRAAAESLGVSTEFLMQMLQ